MTKQVHLIAAARPNFMKVAPLYHALRNAKRLDPVLVHTGQHYDPEMSGVFLQELALPAPDVQLGVGSGSHAEQTAAVMVAYEKICLERRPDCVVVVGDVNSTMACTLAAKKIGLPVAHLEAGLRSGDRSMPEELNRIVTDALADLLWTPSPDADDNLRREGIPDARICRVGNIMMDSYEMLRPKIEAEHAAEELGLQKEGYGVLTLHRPSNVDDAASLNALLEIFEQVGRELPLVFPIHPRTRQRLESFGLLDRVRRMPGMHILEPLGYIRFMSLVGDAAVVVTDSGGVQEETTYLGIPCLTLRDTTERPITITHGTNRLVSRACLLESTRAAMGRSGMAGACPALWDGKTAGRVAASLEAFLA